MAQNEELRNRLGQIWALINDRISMANQNRERRVLRELRKKQESSYLSYPVHKMIQVEDKIIHIFEQSTKEDIHGSRTEKYFFNKTQNHQ